jgi:hypothetical protein
MSQFHDISHACYNYILRSYRGASDKVLWLRSNTTRYDADGDELEDYALNKKSMLSIVYDSFSDDFNIKLTQKKGIIVLQGLIIKEINKCIEYNMKGLTEYIFKEHNVKCFEDIFNPKPVATPTDIEAIQCFVCATNKKDRALPCGHSYCCVCVATLPNGKCPECNKVFDKDKVIKLYL